MNRVLNMLLVVCLAAALPAAAQSNATCWNRDLERMDFYTNPPSRGDNTFFSFTVSGTANVTMIYPNTLTMRQLPISLYELRASSAPNPLGTIGTRGCSNSVLNALRYFMQDVAEAPVPDATCAGFYNAALQYPEPDVAYAGGSGVAAGFESGAGSTGHCPATGYTRTATDQTGGLAWLFTAWPNDATAGVKSGTKGSIDETCNAAVGNNTSGDYQDCQACVKTKGYWINYNKNIVDQSTSAFVAKGNWLNFFPPKWEILHLAYKRLVNGPLLNPLREGIGTQNGSAGWYRLQKMLPQSCSGQGRPNQRISSVDGLKYDNTTNPLAEMLFNVAWTVSSQGSTPPSTWGFFANQNTHPNGEPGPNSDAGKKAGFCPGCNAGFSVLFSDGRGIDGWQRCDSSQYLLGALDPSFPGYCKNSTSPYAAHDSKAACSGSTAAAPGLGLGGEADGDNFLNPTLGADVAQLTASGGTFYTSNAGVCPNDWLPNVAAWMLATNLASNSNLAANNVPGTNLRLYTVGLGDNYFGELNTLKAAATRGGGPANFLNASNFADLEKNITHVFLDIISNATSFSVAAITTVQTRGTTFAFIPRFRPLGGSQWEGRLYRFRLFNEFAAGCGPDELSGGPDGGPVKDSLNPNGNATCNDLYLQDADGGFVGEDDGGTFILLDTTQPFTDAGWPAKSPKVLATPIWEAADILTAREQNSSTNGGAGTARQILTVNMDAGFPAPPTTPQTLITYNDFSDAGVALITNYMQLGGVNSDFCVGMSSVTRHPYATQEDCGRDLMKFMDGQDVMRQNTDGGSVRPLILGDIFHSSPILVTPPAPTFLCETGIVNQCVRTLYAEDVPCPLGSSGGGCTPNSKAAYATYIGGDAGTRQELLLVGANDGMLHAFQAGTAVTGDGGVTSYDDGTGQEVWAFIPPDMLPKLQRYALSESHSILVDGTPWVRDIWKDGSGASAADGQKQFDEFHTIAVVGERTGGRHYHAIDVTDTSSPPKFLWTFPQPGSEIDLAQGESWNDTTPNPPSIGPILLKNASTGKIALNGSTGLEERWVIAIAGGYDPNLIRGRAIYIVDAYDGTLLFRYSRYDVNNSSAPCPGGGCEPRTNLSSIAAPISLVDTNFDNFFDLAVFGDVQGNVHVLDMLNPGDISSGQVNNWFGGLAFQQFGGHLGPQAISNRSPFFSMAGARVFDDSKGGVRIYLGGGDRDQIKVRDTDAIDGGTCQLDNLRGCVRNNCTVDVKQQTYTIGTGGTAETFTGEWSYAPNGFTTTTTFALGINTGAGACTDPAVVDIQYKVNCASTDMVDPNDGGATILNELGCDFDGGSDAGEECYDTRGKELGVGVAFASPPITKSRFYSIKVFDPDHNPRGRPRMIDNNTQGTFNRNTLGDGDLTNETDGGVMNTDAGGWYVIHDNDPNEKTASAALLLGGCVAWNTVIPSILNTGVGADGGQICQGGTIPADTAFLYQGNDDTGAIQCGLPGSATQLATLRYIQRMVTVTPQQPTPVVSLNAKTGQAGYSGVSLEPGGKIPLQVSVGAASVQGDVAWIDVSRNLHNCRHPATLADGGTAASNCQ